MNMTKQSPKSAYENVISVSFVYALGVVAGRTADAKEIILDSINFFQQTPEDERVGDLLALWKGKCFLIEFKRTKSQLNDELKKAKKINLGETLQNKSDQHILSRKGHFIAYGSYSKKEKHTLADLIFQKYASLLNNMPDQQFNVNDFINNTMKDDRFGLTAKELEKYTQFLRDHADQSDIESSDSRRSSSGTGIMTAISPEGKVISFAYDTYDQLSEFLDQKISLNMLLSQQLATEQSIKQVVGMKAKEEKKISKVSNSGGGEGRVFASLHFVSNFPSHELKLMVPVQTTGRYVFDLGEIVIKRVISIRKFYDFKHLR